MAQVKFGAAQLKNPTPANWSNVINVSTVILGALITYLGTRPNPFPVGMASNIQSISGLLLTIGNGLKPFLGVETTQKNVPIDDVASMKADA